MIKLDSVTHYYDLERPPVIEGISFDIRKGECLGLVGPSGCGKSTLAKIISGYLMPTAGTITLDDQNITFRPNRKVIMISQDLDLFPWQTTLGHLLFAMIEKDEVRAKELIKLVKLEGFEKFHPHHLSEGMKKRLALARALAINPKLLILDEAFSSLDQNLKKQLYQELKDIWQKTDTTILLISHDPEEIDFLTKRKIVLPKQTA